MNHIHKAFICFNTCYYSHFGHSDSNGLTTMKSSSDLNCCSDIYSSIINHYNTASLDMVAAAIMQISFPANLKSSTHSAPVHCLTTYLMSE